MMQVLQANCSMPVVGDQIILADKEDDDNQEVENVQPLDWDSRNKIFSEKRYVHGYCIVPPIVPDSLMHLRLSQEALEAVITMVSEVSKKIDSDSKFKDSLEGLLLVKLLLLQRTQDDKAVLNKLSGASRQKLSFALKKLSALEDGSTEDTGE